MSAFINNITLHSTVQETTADQSANHPRPIQLLSAEQTQEQKLNKTKSQKDHALIHNSQCRVERAFSNV